MKHPNMPSSKEQANINHSTTSLELIGHGTTDINWGWFRGTPFRSPLQGSLKGLGARGGGRDEGLKVERGLHLRKASRGLQGGLKGASGGFKGA